jgi:hypothetical protein
MRHVVPVSQQQLSYLLRFLQQLLRVLRGFNLPAARLWDNSQLLLLLLLTGRQHRRLHIVSTAQHSTAQQGIHVEYNTLHTKELWRAAGKAAA